MLIVVRHLFIFFHLQNGSEYSSNDILRTSMHILFIVDEHCGNMQPSDMPVLPSGVIDKIDSDHQ